MPYGYIKGKQTSVAPKAQPGTPNLSDSSNNSAWVPIHMQLTNSGIYNGVTYWPKDASSRFGAMRACGCIGVHIPDSIAAVPTQWHAQSAAMAWSETLPDGTGVSGSGPVNEMLIRARSVVSSTPESFIAYMLVQFTEW